MMQLTRMKTQTVVIFVVLSLFGLSSANRKPLRPQLSIPKSRIIGGQEVTPESIPFQVLLITSSGTFYCGGTLLSENYVLTAAYCAMEFKSGAYVMFVDGSYLTGLTLKIHENYDNKTYRNNIAIVELDKSVELGPEIQPVTLPPISDIGRTYESAIASAIGYGFYNDNSDEPSSVPLEVEVPVMNLSDCAAYYNHNVTYVIDTNVCTSGYQNRGICNGDTGGPLILDGIQIGITSFGAQLCEMCTPSVYTRVVDYLDWIAANSNVKIK